MHSLIVVVLMLVTRGVCDGQARRRDEPPSRRVEAREITIPALGLRVLTQLERVPIATGGTSIGTARVVAVQDKSPALFGGVQPGDLILSIGRRTLTSGDAGDFLERLMQVNKVGLKVQMEVQYPVRGGPKLTTETVHMALEEPRAGAWITTVQLHEASFRKKLPEFERSREEAAAEYRKMEAELKKSIVANPCGLTQNDIGKWAADLRRVGLRSNITASDADWWEGIRRNACNNSRDGGLPAFEGALQAMTDARRLDPCSYDPAKDYSAIVNDPAYLAFGSRASYDSGATVSRYRVYLGKASEEQRACFLDLIKTVLEGRTWKPRR